MTTYGYARVSSRDQNLDRQLSAFAEYGIAESNIYADKKSGKNFLRARYMQLKKKLKKGDLLIVAALNRLGRNYEQIIDEWEYITKRIGADIVVLDMPLLDTRAGRYAYREIRFGRSIAGPFVRGGKRAPQYPRAAGGRNKTGKRTRRKIRQTAQGIHKQIYSHDAGLQRKAHRPARCAFVAETQKNGFL